jgi:hypothetical protein
MPRFALLALLTSLAAFSARGADAPLLRCQGLPCADFTASQVPKLRLLIDTGNAKSILDLERARALGATLAPYLNQKGEAVPDYQIATLHGLMLGKDPVGDVQFLVLDLKPSIGEGSFPRADGSLSYRELKERMLVLDFKRERLTLKAPADECAARCASLSYPTFGNKGPPIVVSSGFEINGVALSMQVDTLYSGTMLIYPPAVERAGLVRQSHSVRQRKFPFTDGGVEMIEAEGAREGFAGHLLSSHAPVYFATEKVHTPDGLFDGTVGSALFKNQRVTFDFHHNRFWLG